MDKLHNLYSWLTVADYTEASEAATRRVVKRFARGNVSTQNGWYLNEKDFASLSARGDKAVDHLAQIVR
jgi:hypothetical protein